MNDITVILTPEDAEAFKMFQQHYDLFNTMIDKGIFDIQFGKCIFNIAFGDIQNIVVEEVVWKK